MARRHDDDLITEPLKNADMSLGGKTLHIGIRNEAGSIYRSIEATGPGQIIKAFQALHDLGFKDELERAANPVEGSDAIFSK